MNANLGSHLSGVDTTSLVRDVLRQCDVEDTLRLIAGVAAEQAGRSDSDGNRTFPGWQLALLVRLLLESEQERGGRTMSLTRSALARCCDLAVSIVSSPGTAYWEAVPDGAWSLMHRVAYQQLPDQEEQGYAPRSLAIYRQIAPRLQESAGFRFEDAYQHSYGLSMDEAWTVGQGLYRWCIENPGKTVDSPGLAKTLAHDGIGKEKVESFLKTISCDYKVYRSLLGLPSPRQAHFEPYNLNPFRKYPVLRLPHGDYLVPLPIYLLRRITHGLYYDLIELDRPGYLALIGRAFSAYVGELLEAHAKSIAPLADGAWLIHDSDAAIAIECITRPFGALSRATGDPAQIRADLARRGGVVDSVKRLQDFLGNPTEPAQGKQLIGVVVALEDFYLANGPLIRGIVSDELKAQGRPGIEAEMQLAHVGGLEALCALSQNTAQGLCSFLTDKVGHAEFRELELEEYARFMALRHLPGQDIDFTPPVLKRAASHYLGESGVFVR